MSVRISVKDKQGDSMFGIEVPLENPPTVIKPPSGDGPPMTLNWDRALDDHKQLRHCLVCGCPDLYVRKPFPQLTAFTLIIAAAVLAMVFYGFDQVVLAIVAFAVVLAVDVAIYLMTAQILTCYNCKADYRKVSIPRGAKRWEAAVAEKYRAGSKR